MTGTASSKCKILMDFDSYKNQEWLRRRKLRLEQVRKQSNEIARVLRQKASDEEKKRLEEYKKLREEELRIWKTEKLEDLDRKLKFALEEFGSSYRLAEEEPEAELIMEEKNKVNLSMAQKRGEIAHQEELKRNKIVKENLMSGIERKKMARKREDLRSALVRSVPTKKQVVYEQADQPDEQKITLMKKIKRKNDKSSAGACKKKSSVGKKNRVNQKFCTCKSQLTELPESKACPTEGVETLWINLDEVQISSAGESEPNLRGPKSSVNNKKGQKEKNEGSVEFYDFSSRYYCKSFREYPHLVERVKYDSKELNANDLAKVEEMERAEAKKKLEVDVLSQDRGMKALRKEKVIRDYNNLMMKLEELSKKEKILKSQQRNPPSFLHMDDERLSERKKTRQRIMESKFERVYYGETAKLPPMVMPYLEPAYDLTGAGDYLEAEQGRTTKLSFSPSNLKHNSPVTYSEKSFSEVSLPETTQCPVKGDNEPSQKQLLININNTLRKGRQLRKSISRNWKSDSSKGKEEKEMSWDSESETVETRNEEELPVTERTLTKYQELQTENINEEKDLRLRNLYRGAEDSIPFSTSTSYKSPPGVIRSLTLQPIYDYLEGLNDIEEHCLLQDNPKFLNKVNTILHDLINEEDSAKSEEDGRTSPTGPTLRYYIEKLLNMSRECIANLSVSSETISTPNITDLDTRNESEAPDSRCLSRTSFKEEDLVRKFSLEGVEMLENSIKNWKMIFEKNSRKPQPEPQDVPKCLEPEKVQGKKTKVLISDTCSPKIMSRYDEITKKCSERILELSGMLDKVRKDKEKLLSSASGGSSVNLNKSERNLEKAFEAEGEKVPHTRGKTPRMRKTSPVLEGFINRYNLTRPREETVSTTAVADSQSLDDSNESLESWPDVMDELLKREILSSPFKWSDGELSSEFTTINDNRTKPSSIESVICNFRKEIDKIKPFSLAESSSQSNSPIRPRWSADGEYREMQNVSCLKSGVLKEESSVESIDHCLTSLGLNWAKSFLRKNAECRAKNSSSNSEKKLFEDEDENYL